MSLEFYEITTLVEMAYCYNQQATIDALIALRDKSLKMGSHTQAEIIHHAAVQLTRGQGLQVIQVDGSATAPAQAPAEAVTEVAQEPVPTPVPDAPRRKRRA